MTNQMSSNRRCSVKYSCFFAPNSLKSQDTNFIDNRLKGCMSLKIALCFVTGSSKCCIHLLLFVYIR